MPQLRLCIVSRRNRTEPIAMEALKPRENWKPNSQIEAFHKRTETGMPARQITTQNAKRQEYKMRVSW